MGVQTYFLLLTLSLAGLSTAYHHCKVTYPHYWGIAITERRLNSVRGHNGFVKMGHDMELGVTLYSHPTDPRLILLYDHHGHLAGARVCFVKDNIDQQAKWNHKEFTYYYDKIPSFTSRRYWGVDAWCKDMLFQSPEELKSGGRNTSQWTNIWVKLDKDVFVKLPTDECHVEALGFTKQGCYYGMGRHYFYEMTPWLDCSTYGGMVIHFQYGKMCGAAFAIPGWHGNFKLPKSKMWFENATKDVVEKIVLTYPPCWLENAYNFGLQDIHFMFVENPLNIQCLWPWQIEDQCTYRSDHIVKYKV